MPRYTAFGSAQKPSVIYFSSISQAYADGQDVEHGAHQLDFGDELCGSGFADFFHSVDKALIDANCTG